jgi:hypothetical protein
MKTFEGRGDLTDTSKSVPAAEALKQFKVSADLVSRPGVVGTKGHAASIHNVRSPGKVVGCAI